MHVDMTGATINLPAAAAGQSVQLKWRSATDSSAVAPGAAGVRIDDVTLSQSTSVCGIPAVGTVPTVSSLATQNILEDGSTAALGVTVGDNETPVAVLQLTASSNNTALVPNANIVVGGSGASRTVQVTPLANASGTATITLTVTDTDFRTTTTSFDVIVAAVNDAPSFTVTGNLTNVSGVSGVRTIPNFVASINFGPGEGTQTVLTYSTSEVSDPNNILTGPAIAVNGTLTYTLTGAATGVATIRGILQDSGGTANGGTDSSVPVEFTVTLVPNVVFGNGFE